MRSFRVVFAAIIIMLLTVSVSVAGVKALAKSSDFPKPDLKTMEKMAQLLIDDLGKTIFDFQKFEEEEKIVVFVLYTRPRPKEGTPYSFFGLLYHTLKQERWQRSWLQLNRPKYDYPMMNTWGMTKPWMFRDISGFLVYDSSNKYNYPLAWPGNLIFGGSRHFYSVVAIHLDQLEEKETKGIQNLITIKLSDGKIMHFQMSYHY